MKNIGQLIKDARTKIGISQNELMRRTNMHSGDIPKIENGYRNPTVSLLERIADALGMEVEIKFKKKPN